MANYNEVKKTRFVSLFWLMVLTIGTAGDGRVRPFVYPPKESPKHVPTSPAEEPVPPPVEERVSSARGSDRSFFRNPFDQVDIRYSARQVSQWKQIELDEKVCNVSPIIEYFPGKELNHHQVTIDFSGEGKVEVSVAHSTKNDLSYMISKRHLHRPFVQAVSGRQMEFVSPYKGERCVWVLLRTKGSVVVHGVRYQCLCGRGTLYGHSARQYTFAGVALPYRIMAPRHPEPGVRYPLVITIGGSGGIGNDNRKNMEMVGLPRSLYTRYFTEPKFACYSIVPQVLPAKDYPAPYWPKGPKGNPTVDHPDAPFVNKQGWYTQASLALIRNMLQDPAYAIDPQRVYLTGFSLGGKGTWEFLQAAPDMFAGVLSVGGWAIGRAYARPTTAMRKRLKQKVQTYKHVPVYITAGELDLYMAMSSRMLHEILTEEGGTCIYKELSKTKHVPSAGRTWGSRKIMEWLFNQNKKQPIKDGA